jgi:hypothetical protein
MKVGLISVPSILYGSSIKKGTVDLKYYITGTLVSQVKDSRENGELVQTYHERPDASDIGSVVGIVLYNEGFVLLTASFELNPDHTEVYRTGESAEKASWIYFGQSILGSKLADADVNPALSSYEINYSGTHYVPTVMMHAHAPKGQLNNSTNPTFTDNSEKTGTLVQSSSIQYMQNENLHIKNIASSSYLNHTSSFTKTTYLSKIGIYDKNKNLIAIAKMANPVRKEEDKDYTFRLKIDT